MIGHIASPTVHASVPGVAFARPGAGSPPADGARNESGERAAGATPGATRGSGAGPQSELSAEELRAVKALEARDAEVRAHEAAHMSAGGDLVRGAASFSYQRGPDGRPYAIGGEVSIDTSAERTPEETIAKAERIRAAALAPAQPSAQDMQVAAQAARLAAEARSQLAAANRNAYQSGAAGRPGSVIDEYA